MAYDEKKKGEDTELLEEEKDSDPVIQEQIKPWQRRKFKKVMSVIGFSLLAGIIFGVAARFVFRYSDRLISKIFGLNEPYDNIGTSRPVTLSPQPSNQTPSGDDTGVKINQNSREDGKGYTDGPVSDDTNLAGGYLEVIESLRKTSENLSKSVVNINAVTSVMNWLDEKIEQSESSLGIIVTESTNELFILTYYDRIKSADRIEMNFNGGNNYSLNILAVDETYNIAVLLLPKQSIKPEDIGTFEVLKVGDSDEIYTGLPVIGIGSVDGSKRMVEYGFITSDSYLEYITDAAIGLFTTNLAFTDKSMGIITDTEGNLIGIITRQLGSSINADINKCIKVNSIVKIAEKLCNNEGRLYFGIVAEDIPGWALAENNLEYGIYVNNVEPSSPASDAGIRKGDFIIGVDGNRIDSVESFAEILMAAGEGKIMNIDVYRTSKSTDQMFTVQVKTVKRK